MISRYNDLKLDAIKLRKRGLSIGRIEERLSIPRSTLSGWFKNIELSKKQKRKLIRAWKLGLVLARKKAVEWHNNEKKKRLLLAEQGANKIIQNINFADRDILELALALLYLGEGTKKKLETSMGSSDPLILKFFVTILDKVYKISIHKIKCQLFLRADQSPEKIKRYWARELNLPVENFLNTNIDKRTMGSKTYSNYNGVCYVRCGNVAIQRKLLYLSQKFVQGILTSLRSNKG